MNNSQAEVIKPGYKALECAVQSLSTTVRKTKSLRHDIDNGPDSPQVEEAKEPGSYFNSPAEALRNGPTAIEDAVKALDNALDSIREMLLN